jgi:hypothetical protein
VSCPGGLPRRGDLISALSRHTSQNGCHATSRVKTANYFLCSKVQWRHPQPDRTVDTDRQTGVAYGEWLLSPHETDDRPAGSKLVETALLADICSLHSRFRPRAVAVSAPPVDRTHDTFFRGVEFLVEEG